MLRIMETKNLFNHIISHKFYDNISISAQNNRKTFSFSPFSVRFCVLKAIPQTHTTNQRPGISHVWYEISFGGDLWEDGNKENLFNLFSIPVQCWGHIIKSSCAIFYCHQLPRNLSIYSSDSLIAIWRDRQLLWYCNRM